MRWLFQIGNFFTKRQAWFIFCVTFLVYSPLLGNQYVGDDTLIIERNTFYHSWKNIPRVFVKGCIPDLSQLNFNAQSQCDLATAKESYRPVSNLSYFLDYYLFGAKAYGSHLIDILIHCGNAVLVYGMVSYLFASSALAVFAALLFALHPINSEAVAIMSYRADILAALFVLGSFYCWIQFKQGGYRDKRYYGGCVLTCACALLSKESALMLPLVIFVFDMMMAQGSAVRLRQKSMYYFGLLLVLSVYIYLYFFVFSSTVVARQGLEMSGVRRCLWMGHIACDYLSAVLMPWTVKAIPGHYQPTVPNLISLATGKMVFVYGALGIGIACFWRKYKEAVFFVLWYLIFYLPASNVVSLFNPVANRYMYLPSIGLVIALAFLIDTLCRRHNVRKYSKSLLGIIYGGLILLCTTRTLFLNQDWRTNNDAAWAWIRDYPQDGQGYAILGRAYLFAGHVNKAKLYLEKSIALGNPIPSDRLILADCYGLSGQYQAAEDLLNSLTQRFPNYSDAFLLLGRIYYVQHKNRQAQEILGKVRDVVRK